MYLTWLQRRALPNIENKDETPEGKYLYIYIYIHIYIEREGERERERERERDTYSKL